MPVPVIPGASLVPGIADLDNNIQQLQVRIAQLQKQRDSLAADQASIDAQRPAGIPPNWMAAYDGNGASIKITAWYDPNKYGTGFRLP